MHDVSKRKRILLNPPNCDRTCHRVSYAKKNEIATLETCTLASVLVSRLTTRGKITQPTTSRRVLLHAQQNARQKPHEYLEAQYIVYIHDASR